MINSKLGIGPMSSEVIEAVYRYSHFFRKELMLIVSKNQVDYSGGYVNNWNTEQYTSFLEEMRNKYSNSNVKSCRDHCGPGFSGNMSMEDTYKTIETDIENRFDLIHIDLCHYQGTNKERLYESKKAIEHCLNLNNEIALEIGTDENVGSMYSINSLEEIQQEIDFFKSFSNPDFYVVQTGSLVMEINQMGSFNKSFLIESNKLIHENDIKIKEHNADYLSKSQIQERNGIVDAMNIAPQLGVVQTSYILNKCLIYGINFDDYANLVYKSKKWEKWMHKNNAQNKYLCIQIAGHYHFSSDEYKIIINQLNNHEDINENIIETLTNVIDHYESCN